MLLPKVITKLLEVQGIKKEQLLSDYEFKISDKIVYDVLDHPYPIDSDNDEWFHIDTIQAKNYELLVDLLSMFYTKIFDRKHYRLLTMFEHFDEKYTPKALEPKDTNNQYGSNSELLAEYKKKIRQIPQRDTRQERDVELQTYYKDRLINYGEFLFFLGKLELISNKGEILYTYIHEEFAGFFQWACGYYSNMKLQEVKNRYKPNYRGYIEFLRDFAPKDNKLLETLTNKKFYIFLSRETLQERLEDLKQTKEYQKHLKEKKQRELEDEDIFEKMAQKINSTNKAMGYDSDDSEAKRNLEKIAKKKESNKRKQPKQDKPKPKKQIPKPKHKPEKPEKSPDPKQPNFSTNPPEPKDLINEFPNMSNEEKKEFLDNLF